MCPKDQASRATMIIFSLFPCSNAIALSGKTFERRRQIAQARLKNFFIVGCGAQKAKTNKQT